MFVTYSEAVLDWLNTAGRGRPDIQYVVELTTFSDSSSGSRVWHLIMGWLVVQDQLLLVLLCL